jgi:hypothetical protein
MTGPAFLLGAVASAASCLLCMEIGGISLKDSLVLPEYAKREVVYRQHGDVIRKVESIISSSYDLAAADSRLNSAFWPGKVLHISLTPASGSHSAPASGYSRGMWTNMRSVIRDGSGYGTVLTAEGTTDLLIADGIRRSSGMKDIHYTIYVERSAL